MASGPKKTAFVTDTPALDNGVETVAATVVAAPVADAMSEAVKAPLASLNELHGNLRTAVEKGLVETRAAYAKAKTTADETASAIETSYAAAKAGVVAINVKAFEALRANLEANFDFMKSAIAVKNASDFVTLQGEFTRRRLEAMTDQTKEIGELAQKLASQTAQPIKEQVAKTFKIAV
jgi:phasin